MLTAPACDNAQPDLVRILQEHWLKPWFQPVADLFHGQIYGYESLIRGPTDCALHMPFALFQEARRCSMSQQLELASLRAGMAGFPALGGEGKLFLNLSGGVLLACWHKWATDLPVRLLGEDGPPLENVVLELTEHDPLQDDLPELARAVACLRTRGVRIALDDYGSGYSSLKVWTELRPDIIKMDRYFVNGIGADITRQKMMRAMIAMANSLDAVLLAEGVETEADLAMVCELGIRYAQGWVLGRPQAELATVLPENALKAIRLERPVSDFSGAAVNTVASLGLAAPALKQGEHTNDDAHGLFRAHPELHALAVVNEENHPVGLVNRRDFLEQYARPYMRDLYGRHSCSTFMNPAPLLVDVATTVDRLGPVLISGDQRYLQDGFILTDGGRYAGLGTGESLVRAVTELRIEAARYANPLTALPGNVPISRHMDQLLEGPEEFTVCYGDLDNFKPYNDVYGYWRGDDMILLCADVLKRHCQAQRDFVGHVGGDDFVLLLRSADWRARIEAAIQEFNDRARAMYDEADRLKGGIEAEDRYGVPRFFSFVTLSVGALRVRPAQSQRIRPHEIASAAARIKRKVKHGCSPLMIEDYATAAAIC
ncbi:EAL domain-containing protein [Bordetella sp. 2513F-2]